MINDTIILLTYYHDYEDYKHGWLAYAKEHWLGIHFPFELYLHKPLQQIFSKVILCDYLKRMTEIGFKALNKEIINLVRKEHPKYVFWTSWQYDIQESTLETIRKEGSIVAGLFFDDEWRFDDYSKWWIPYLDYCVTNAIEAIPKYRELGARVIQTIPSTGIAVDRDWSNIEEKYDVSFVGHRLTAGREQYISELKNRNIPIHLFGVGWGRLVSFEEMIDIYGSSKINLNFSKVYDSFQIKGRIFQVCNAGGFLLTEYVPGIESYFEIDKEIVCFKNADEMIDKITYYLNHDEERRAIAQAGWKRAINKYTPFHMFSRVFDEIERDIATKDKEDNPHPQELRMPMQIRKRFSDYYLRWGLAFLAENYNGLWKDALALSIRYYPFNTWAWYHYIIGFFPSFMRPALIRLYTALLSVLGYIPYLRKIKRSLVRRFFPT